MHNVHLLQGSYEALTSDTRPLRAIRAIDELSKDNKSKYFNDQVCAVLRSLRRASSDEFTESSGPDFWIQASGFSLLPFSLSNWPNELARLWPSQFSIIFYCTSTKIKHVVSFFCRSRPHAKFMASRVIWFSCTRVTERASMATLFAWPSQRPIHFNERLDSLGSLFFRLKAFWPKSFGWSSSVLKSYQFGTL